MGVVLGLKPKFRHSPSRGQGSQARGPRPGVEVTTGPGATVGMAGAGARVGAGVGGAGVIGGTGVGAAVS